MSVNNVILLGRLGDNPELSYTPTSTAVCKFSLATSKIGKDKNDKKTERTTWHKIVAFGNRAENCHKFLTKGSQALVEGEIQNRSYDDKEGVKKYVSEIIARKVEFFKNGNSQDEQLDENGIPW